MAGILLLPGQSFAQAPATLTVPTADYDGTFTVSWYMSAPNGGYARLFKRFNGGAWMYVGEGLGSQSRTITATQAGNYDFYVSWGYVPNCGGPGGCSIIAGSTAIKTTVVSLDPPASAPTLTLASTNNNGSYPVSWNVVTGATSYKWRERVNGGTWSGETTVTGTSISPSPSGKLSATYGYQVRACNSHGCTGYSAEKSIIVAVTPGIPASISASPNPSTGNVNVSWGAASGSVTKYDFDYKLSTSGTWTNGYDGTGLSKSLNLSVGTWNYQVRACKTQSTYTSCSGWRSTSSTVMVPPASAPTFTEPAGNVHEGGFTVSWSSVTGAASYELQQKINAGGWSTIQNTSATSKPITGTIGNDYHYQVKACNAVGCSAYSAVKTVLVGARLTVPATDSDGDGSYTVSWTNGYNEIRLYEKFGAGDWVKILQTGAPYGNQLITHTANDTYYYRLDDCYYEGTQGGVLTHCNTSDYGSVVVSGINQPPTISDIANQQINEDTDTGNITFTVSDPEMGPLTVTATSDNIALVPNSGSNLVLTGTGGSRTIKVIPAANQHGTATITVKVTDDGSLFDSDTFDVIVANQPDLNLPATSNTSTFTVTFGGAATYSQLQENVDGSWETVSGSSGDSMESVQLTRADGTHTFQLVDCEVIPNPPSGSTTQCSTVLTKSIVVDAPAPTIVSAGFSPASIDESGSATFSWNVTGATSCSASGLSGVSGTSGNVTYNAPTSMSADQTVAVDLTCDGLGGSTTETATITVHWINDAPTISDIPDKTINEDSDTGEITFTVSDEETLAGSLSVTASSSNTALVPITGSNLILGNSGGSRTIKVVPLPDQSGSTTITVNVSDGANPLVSDTFELTVLGYVEVEYRYDALGRLVRVDENQITRTGYCYDKAGNRYHVEQGGADCPDEPPSEVPTGLSAVWQAGPSWGISWNAVAGADSYTLRLNNGTEINTQATNATTQPGPSEDPNLTYPTWVQACFPDGHCGYPAYF